MCLCLCVCIIVCALWVYARARARVRVLVRVGKRVSPFYTERGDRGGACVLIGGWAGGPACHLHYQRK